MQRSQLDEISPAYEKDGYVIVRNVVARDRMAAAEQHVHATLAQHPGVAFDKLHQMPFYHTDPFYLQLIRQPQLLDLAAQSLGPDLALFATGYII